jgi:hypothetical protein
MSVETITDTQIPETDGLYPDIGDETYHADRGSLSSTGAKILAKPGGPAKFLEYVTTERKPKRAYDFGHVAHRILLGEGAKYEVLDPAVHGLKKDGTEADNPRATATWKAAETAARATGKVPIHIDDHLAALAMATAVRTHPDAGPLFHRGHAERSAWHTDPDTGIRLRGRFDWLTYRDDRLICVDFKTAVSADDAELTRTFWQLRYYQQFAWYIDLLIALDRDDNPGFLFVVCEKEPPHLVNVVEYDAEAYLEGHRENRRAINLYAHGITTGQWPGYAPGIKTLSLPPWAIRPKTLADLLQEETA